MSDVSPWKDCDGEPLVCTEKLRVLRENESELRQLMQDVYEDGIVMGVSPDSMRESILRLIETLKSPFRASPEGNENGGTS